MFNSIYFKGARPSESKFINPSSMFLVPVQDTKDGVLSYSSEFKVINNAELNSRFCYSDFALANIIAVGDYSSLTPVIMTNNSDVTFVDQFSRSMSSVQIPVANE